MSNNKIINPEIYELVNELLVNGEFNHGLYTVKLISCHKIEDGYKARLTRIDDGYICPSSSMLDISTKENAIISAISHMIDMGSLSGIDLYISKSKATSNDSKKTVINKPKPVEKHVEEEITDLDEELDNEEDITNEDIKKEPDYLSDSNDKLLNLIISLVVS